MDYNTQQEKRNAKGSGNVRQRKDGRWEARCTINGKSRSFYADKQADALKAMRAAQKAKDDGAFIEPSKSTVSQWMNFWMEEYKKPSIRPTTYAVRYGNIKNHLIPELGHIKLQSLTPSQIQSLLNRLRTQKGLAASTIGTIFRTLHCCLDDAVKLKYIRENPANMCKLPKKEKKELVPFSETDIENFLKEIKGHLFEELYCVTLFTGMRLGEICGLSWDAINFKEGTITVKQQLLNSRYKSINIPMIGPTKNGQVRILTVAPFVMDLLKNVRKKQLTNQMLLGTAWKNEYNLVFTNELGKNWSRACVEEHYKAIVTKIGRPDLRFHDLRHTYAVTALQEGDNPKTVQEALGHATAAFTLNVYAHVSDKMRQESAARMQKYFEQLNA